MQGTRLCDWSNRCCGQVLVHLLRLRLSLSVLFQRRLVKIPHVTSAGPASSWPDHIAQHPKDVLRGALALKGDVLVVRYLRDVVAALQLRQLGSGALTKELPLPGVGSVGAMSGDRKGSELFFSFTSFTEPGALYRIDTAPGSALEPQLFRRTELKVPHSADDYVTKQVFVTSADGTQVPMFITHHKDTKLDGSAPTLLYGYGGFNVPLEPGFSPNRCGRACGMLRAACQIPAVPEVP